jgi:hypothetical protein
VLFGFLDAEVFPRSLKRLSAPNQLGFVYKPRPSNIR